MIEEILLKDRREKIGEGIRSKEKEVVDLILMKRIEEKMIVKREMKLLLGKLKEWIIEDLGEKEEKKKEELWKIEILLERRLLSSLIVLKGEERMMKVEVDMMKDVVEIGVKKIMRGLKMIIKIKGVENMKIKFMEGDMEVMDLDMLEKKMKKKIKRINEEIIWGLVIEKELVRIGKLIKIDVEGWLIERKMRREVLRRES